MNEHKKLFAEPECEIITLAVVDIITSSVKDEPDWGMGEF